MNTFILFAVCSFLGVVAVVGGIFFYLKKSGALRAAANAATDVVKQDVQNAADKLGK